MKSFPPTTHPLRNLTLYLAVVFLGGALIAPWLYWLVQWGAQHQSSLQSLAAAPFHRFVNRSLLVLALAGLWPLLRSLGAKSWREVGLVRPSGQWRKLLAGFALGFVSLALAVGVAVLFGGRVWNSAATLPQIIRAMGSAALTAVIVATLEEILFRGGIFGGLRRVFDWRFALGVSSAVYALVHFLERAEVQGSVTWLSGLQLLPVMLHGFVDVQKLVPGFFALTLVGALLALAYQRTGNLYFSIGLHAGWIFWLKSYGVLTGAAGGASVWFWGTGKLIDGWLAFVVLLATLVIVWKCLWPETSATKHERPG